MATANNQNTFVTNFNADGQATGIKLMTDERGHMYPISKLFEGGVLGDSFRVIAPEQAGVAVTIKKGYIQVPANSNHADFCYLGWMEFDLSLTLAATATTDDRYSAIVAYIDTTKQYSESVTNNPALLVIKEVAGDPATSPVEVTTEKIRNDQEIGNKPFVVLAQVYVPAGAKTIGDGNIIDKRQPITMAQGVNLANDSLAAGIQAGTSSDYTDGFQISVINANTPVPASNTNNLLVFRLAQ